MNPQAASVSPAAALLGHHQDAGGRLSIGPYDSAPDRPVPHESRGEYRSRLVLLEIPETRRCDSRSEHGSKSTRVRGRREPVERRDSALVRLRLSDLALEGEDVPITISRPCGRPRAKNRSPPGVCRRCQSPGSGPFAPRRGRDGSSPGAPGRIAATRTRRAENRRTPGPTSGR